VSPDPPPESAASDGVRHPPESSPVDGADHSTHQVCRPRPWEMLVYLIHICAGITPKVSGFVNKRMKFAIDDYHVMTVVPHTWTQETEPRAGLPMPASPRRCGRQQHKIWAWQLQHVTTKLSQKADANRPGLI